MPDKFIYEIGGKTYIQAPLVLGQFQQLMKLLEGVVFSGELTPLSLMRIIGDKLPQAMAIVLTPENIKLKDKDIHALASELAFEIPPEIVLQVIEDFFDCNPIPSLLERIGTMAEKISHAMIKTGSMNSSASSREEISRKETVSSGDTA